MITWPTSRFSVVAHDGGNEHIAGKITSICATKYRFNRHVHNLRWLNEGLNSLWETIFCMHGVRINTFLGCQRFSIEIQFSPELQNLRFPRWKFWLYAHRDMIYPNSLTWYLQKWYLQNISPQLNIKILQTYIQKISWGSFKLKPPCFLENHVITKNFFVVKDKEH